MLRLPILTLCVLALSGPARALDSVECGAIEAQMATALDDHFDLEVTQGPQSRRAATRAGCEVTALDIRHRTTGLAFRAERLALSGDGLIDWVRADVVLPPVLSARLEGVSLADGATPGPQDAWLSALMGNGADVDLRLSLTWDEAAQALDVTDLTAEFDDTNRLSLRGLAITDGSWRSGATPLSALGVLVAEIDLLNDGVIRTAVAEPLVTIGAIPSPESLAFMGAGFAALVDTAPVHIVSDASQAELGAFLMALPAAPGLLRLRLDSPAPLLPGRVWEDLRTGLPLDAALPGGATITARWTAASQR